MSALRFLGLATAILLWSSPSLAFSFSFANDATANGERGQTQFDFANVDGSGITMTVTARDLTDGAGTTEASLPNPYLDGFFNGLPGGLGVCQAADPSCMGSPDDNLGVGAGLGEVVILSFDSAVTITEVTFRNGIHELVFAGLVGINVGASNPTTAETFSDIFAAVPVLNTNLSGTRFSFVADESFVSGSMGDPNRLYLESVSFVPEPSTGVLIGLSLLALGWRKRSRA